MDEELLKYLVESGKIDLSQVRQEIEMAKRKELLEQHKCKIWQGKDGRFYTRLDSGTKKKLIAKKTYDEMVDAIITFQKELVYNPTIKTVFTEWVERKLELKKIKPSSYMRYKQIFKKHYAKFGERRIKDTLPREYQDFLEQQIPECNMDSKQFSNLRTITKGFLKKAKRDGLIDWNVEEMLMGLDVTKDDFTHAYHEDYEEVFNETETETMIDYLLANKEPKNNAILTMFFTGMRIGEAVALRHGDIEPDGTVIRVRRTETKRENENGKAEFYVADYPKTRAGSRDIFIPTTYHNFVRRLWWDSMSSEYVFEEKGKRLTALVVRKRLRKLCLKLDIYPKSPHKIRKTYGTILMDSKVDQRFIEEQMGHTDIAVSEKHYHRNRKTAQRKTAILDEIPDFCYKNPDCNNLWQHTSPQTLDFTGFVKKSV